MGKVEEFVKEREAEKHLDTEEFIEILRWYIDESGKIDKQFVDAKSDLNNAFNEKMRELATK